MSYRLVFFDVDSTLVTIEGIDVLGRGDPQIVALTEAAMNGAIPLEEVYARRLEIIRPDRLVVESLGASYVASLVEGAAETIEALKAAGVSCSIARSYTSRCVPRRSNAQAR